MSPRRRALLLPTAYALAILLLYGLLVGSGKAGLDFLGWPAVILLLVGLVAGVPFGLWGLFQGLSRACAAKHDGAHAHTPGTAPPSRSLARSAGSARAAWLLSAVLNAALVVLCAFGLFVTWQIEQALRNL